MDISIIIPTLGRESVLLNTLQDLKKQNLNPENWECLIITQNHFSSEFIDKIKDVNILNFSIFYLSQPNASLARNIGLKEAKSDIVLFLDDDITIESKKFLEAHLDNFKKNPDLSGVFGQVIDTNKIFREHRHRFSTNSKFGWLYFPTNYNKNCQVKNGVSVNLSVNKKFAIDIGGMDANYIKGAHREESDFCLRLTKKYGLMNFDVEAGIIHIGENTGGVRSWGHNSGIHPIHHIVGEWYFILNGLFRYKTISFIELPHHLFQIAWRQVFNKANIKKIYPIFIASFKSLKGFFNAVKLYKKKPLTYSENMTYTKIL